MTELAVNVTRENSTTLSNNMELAHDQLQNGGDTLLAKMFTADTFGGLDNVQRQHVIPDRWVRHGAGARNHFERTQRLAG
jgi:hypothetical protein